MLRRLFVIIVSLAFCTTFLTIQQTQQYKIRYDSSISVATPHPVFLGKKRITLMRIEQRNKPSKLRNGSSQRRFTNKKSQKPESLEQKMRKWPSTKNREKLLVPILFYNMGPNNLFRIFKETMPFAKVLNRTLIIPPFHHHPRMKLDQEERGSESTRNVDIQIFDETFESVVEENADHVVDVQLLRQYVAVANMKSFNTKCGRNIDLLVKCGDVSGKREAGLHHFTTFNDITVTRNFTVDNLRDVMENNALQINLKSMIKMSQAITCVGMAIGSKCLGSRQGWFDQWQDISRFAKRPANVRMLANRFMSHGMKSKSFLAVHWRYEYVDWKDMCKDSRPESVRNINSPMCNLAHKFTTNSSFLHDLLTKVEKFTLKQNLEAMYIATPPQLTAALNAIKPAWPRLYTINDIEEYASSAQDDFQTNVFQTNFAVSFLEQEICYRSSYFLGSPLSSWTQTVLLDRVSSDLHQHGSVLDVISEGDNSAYPKLTWYFPEGD